MKKIIKTCFVVGVLCVVVYVASGTDIFKNGLSRFAKPFFELEEIHYFNESVEISKDEECVEDTYFYTKVQKLNIKSAGVEVTFTECEGEEFFVEANMIHEYQTFLKEGELFIVAREQNVRELGKGKVTISIPTAVYDDGLLELDIESSASKIVFDRVVARGMELDVSAGTVSWQELTTGELSIEMAAGTVNGTNTTVTGTSDIKVNAGSITLAGILGTETGIETAAGKVELALTDAYNDYNYALSCAGGSVKIGEQAVEGIAKTLEIEHGAIKHMDIECSVGAVNICFTEE